MSFCVRQSRALFQSPKNDRHKSACQPTLWLGDPLFGSCPAAALTCRDVPFSAGRWCTPRCNHRWHFDFRRRTARRRSLCHRRRIRPDGILVHTSRNLRRFRIGASFAEDAIHHTVAARRLAPERPCPRSAASDLLPIRLARLVDYLTPTSAHVRRHTALEP